VYAVATTGVYCLPSCGARRPRRENVTFFESRPEAEQAGFRACLRCRPDLPPRLERERALVEAACRAIERAAETPSLAELASTAGVSSAHFHRTFKRVLGVTPKAYAEACRTKRLEASLRSRQTVTDALYEAGFGSSGRFYEAAPSLFGMTPSAYRAGGHSEVLQYAVCPCSLGFVLVAVSARGVCAVLLGDAPESLAADLAQRFPRASLSVAHDALQTVSASVVRLVDDPRLPSTVALDIRGTAFQRRVWEALRAIPVGATCSYTELSRRLGNARAVRAVARACGANPLAVVVPCHRVVGAAGQLTGYRWGVDRKQRLLDKERR
jgi:AraC family transcriptional regulator of adaptative response/methylated-DNA-[protein]-cysteine methyltransferase